MWTYYRDVTLYAIAITFLTAIATSVMYDSVADGLVNALLIFGVFGTGLGVLAFNYFQKAQYYMYYNLGFSKTSLVLKAWGVNAVIGILLALLTVTLS